MVASRKSDAIYSSSQVDTRMSWNALEVVVPSALYSSARIPSALEGMPQLISFMLVMTSCTLGNRSRFSRRGF